MSQLYCTGPAHAFLGMPSGNGSPAQVIAYLGTCEESPRVVLRPLTEAVKNALAGGVPFDLSFQGEEAFIGLDLTRWNQPTLDVARQRSTASTSAAFAGQGIYPPGDIGTLALTEAAFFTLYLTFPYSLKPVMAAGGQPLGYRFAACSPIGPDDLGPLSTRNRKEHLMFHAIPIYNPVTGSFLLYDGAVAGLPAIN